MQVGELARRTGTTVRALRYYEAAGLVVPGRQSNGYREYAPIAVDLVRQIRELTALGLSVEETRPFVESLADGREADVCGAAVATYRSAINGLQERIGRLTAQRDSLHERLETAAGRLPAAPKRPSTDPSELVGVSVPSLEFYATDGRLIDFGALGPGRSVVFIYPLTGRPGVDLPDSALNIPGARGSTEEASWFRDHHAELLAAGAARVFGLSAQSTGYQRELVHRLRLPYPLLPDPRMALAAALGVPTFGAGDMVLYRRLTLIIRDGLIEHVFHPIPAPAMHALDVMQWLARRPLRP
jgi:DNA-binding transcriptional MerR regulator/peroxiredoxin